ncbi:enoyl-CoA hydratase/isomerase family protein [Rhodococcus sp. D2-41]|uniref:enoyl-CoA hydratase/isomerase family protein n=1 Tax=Speluncibacter jeojiensis TaxID=2710754 RepID=UPI0024109003|nr:enoyl-CoA hydratase/isomerase family protein [Rhodococcus sp. D2-41]MDG3012253.1 enoyl-CoA hydratase/isomerase family protein [Rhodococcus sp. D2-41]
MSSSSQFVQTRVEHGVGEILLDRPTALNALDIGMIRDMHDTLMAWRDDDAVHTVLVRSAIPKAFCAGGDIRAVREAGLGGDTEAVWGYFSEEYRLDQLIADYPKPYVAVIDGVAMGGGLGISVHGAFRVVTERAVLAMPETAIGFIPDVGASHFLSNLPGSIGMYLGLTGTRLTAADAVELGLATHYVPSLELDDFIADLLAEDIDTALANHMRLPPAGAILDRRERIDAVFSADTVGGMLDRLVDEKGDDDGWAAETLAALVKHSPWSMSVTAELIRQGSGSTLEHCLGRELRVAVKMSRCPDFAEGIRAVLVDKDHAPTWDPATLSGVDPEAVREVFSTPI